MKSTLLADGFAVRIEGIDLGAPMDDATFGEIRALWMENRVAVFPDQTLDDDALVAFTERFGPLFVHVQTQLLASGRKEVMELSNLPGAERPIVSDLAWHTDQSYTPQPVFGTLLYGLVAPSEGGETLFADLAGAWASLPSDLKAKVEGVTAVYSAEPRPDTRETPLNAEERARILDCTHPLVRTHPHLGRKAIYLSPMHIKTIADLDEDESMELLSELTAHATLPEHVYRHTWRIGDVVMWDNTSIMHRRTPFATHERRHLKRTGFYLPDELATPF